MVERWFVYTVGNNRPTLYIGITSDLVRMVYEHRADSVEGFTKKYRLCKLFYYEMFDTIEEAVNREGSSRIGIGSGS